MVSEPPSPSHTDLTLDEIDFRADALPEILPSLSDETLHQADFGIIRLTDEGTVTFYNQFEAEMSGVDSETALGMNFFEDLAPCTNTDAFAGRFRKNIDILEGLDGDSMDLTFQYTFTYRMYPTEVMIRMCRDKSDQNWLLVQPMR